MQRGKVTEPVLKRAVLRNLTQGQLKCGKNRSAAGIGTDCAALRMDGAQTVVLSSEIQTADMPAQWALAVHRAANNLAAGGAKADGILTTILLPSDTSDGEAVLKQIMRQLSEVCRRRELAMLGGDTRVSAYVSAPVVTVTAVGKGAADSLSPCLIQAGDALVVTKWIGLMGTAVLARAYKETLCSRYRASMVDAAAAFDAWCDITEEAQIARACGVHAMHDVTEGGIFGAMWQFAERAGLGLDVDLRKLPIRQETVEICNTLDVNPYLLVSDGCLLIAAPDGRAVTEALIGAGIPAVVVGSFTEGKDKVLHNQDEVRYLEPLKYEELWKKID